MNKGSFIPLVAVIVILLVGLGVYIARSQIGQSTPGQTPSPQTSTSPLPVSSENDLPPLYLGVEWGEPIRGKIFFIDKSGEIIEQDGERIESPKPISLAETKKFTNYYRDALAKGGWLETDYAFGPNGEVYSYEKNGNFITFGYRPLSDSEFVVYLEYN